MGVCNCSMFCCTLLYVHSSIAINLMGKRELVALLDLSSWCLVMVERLFIRVPRGCLWNVIVVFPDHTHLLFLKECFWDFFFAVRLLFPDCIYVYLIFKYAFFLVSRSFGTIPWVGLWHEDLGSITLKK